MGNGKTPLEVLKLKKCPKSLHFVINHVGIVVRRCQNILHDAKRKGKERKGRLFFSFLCTMVLFCIY